MFKRSTRRSTTPAAPAPVPSRSDVSHAAYVACRAAVAAREAGCDEAACARIYATVYEQELVASVTPDLTGSESTASGTTMVSVTA